MPAIKRVKNWRSLAADVIALPWWVMFIILGLGYALALWSNYQFIYTEEILMDHYQKFVSSALIPELIDYQTSRKWIYYLLQQILTISKILVVSIAVFTAAFFIKAEVPLFLIIKIVIVAEFIPFSYEILKLGKLLFVENPGSFEDLVHYAPWSILEVISADVQPFWARHLLGYINVFHGFYFVSLVLLYFICFEKPWTHCFRVVLAGYGSALILWLTFISVLLFHANVTG